MEFNPQTKQFILTGTDRESLRVDDLAYHASAPGDLIDAASRLQKEAWHLQDLAAETENEHRASAMRHLSAARLGYSHRIFNILSKHVELDANTYEIIARFANGESVEEG